MRRLPEVNVFFKKSKRRRELLICVSIAILWLPTIAIILTPCISCPEDSTIDFNPSNGYEKNTRTIRHLVAFSNAKPNTSRNINDFPNFRFARDILSAQHERQSNTKSSRRSFPNQSVNNTEALGKDPKQGYLLRIRKYNARKRWERYRRELDGSGDGDAGIASVAVTNRSNTTGRKKTTPTRPTQATTFASRSKSPDDLNAPSLAPDNDVENSTEYSVLLDNVNASTSSSESSVASTDMTKIETAAETATSPPPPHTTTTTTTTTTTIATTTRDPCDDFLALVPSRVFFPSNHVLAYQMRVRISMENPRKIPVKYNVSIYHNEHMVQSQVTKDNPVNITDLLPCRHYNACVVALFDGCLESKRVCNNITTDTNITNVDIKNLEVQADTRNATICFDWPVTDCKLNYSITVNDTTWKFNAENSLTLISSNAVNGNAVMRYNLTADSSRNRLSFALTGLSPYTSYHVEVRAESARSRSPTTKENFRTKPSAPTPVRNATCIINSANISWEAPENFNGEFRHYKLDVFVCQKNGTECSSPNQFHPTESHYNFSFARPGHQYKFQIRAKTRNVSDYGNAIEITCNIPPLPLMDHASEYAILVVAWVFTFILLLILSVFLLIVLQRKKIIKLPCVCKWYRSGRSSQDLRSVAIPFRVTSKPVQLVDFEEHYRTMTADSSFKFSQEFEELVSGSPSCPTTAAQLSENRGKNRWINILPFDHSRVKLLPIADDVFTDYINASYIPGYRSQREFIASQGPLSNTKDDFWRMVWEQNCPMIVMVTQCIERGKEKCEQYWPQDRETHYYGDLAVKLKSESILTGYTLRIFDLHLKEPMTTSPTAIDLSDLLELIPRFPEIEKGSRSMEVKQMYFTMWPDFGCPENTSLLINFVGSVRDHMPHDSNGPIIVHCSAGVGRTGTFIAVDKLMQHIEDHDFVDVFGTIHGMRNYRTNMVQTEDQYMYIHECVKDLLIDMQTRTPISKDSGESMIDSIGMAQSDIPSRKRRTESSVCDLSDPEVTETTVLLSVTTGASDLTDTVFSELTDTTSVISERAISEPEPHGDDDKFDHAFVRESPKSRLSSTNRMSHDPKDTFLHFAVGGEPLCLQPTETTQSGDSTDIPLSNLTEVRSNPKADIWYF